MKKILLSAMCLSTLLLSGCLPPTQDQLRMEMDLEEMKRRLAKVEQGSAEILQGGGGASRQELDALNRQLAEQQSGLDTLRVELQSIYGRFDDLAHENQSRGDDLGLIRDDLGMQLTALEDRLMKTEQELEQLKSRPGQAAPVVAPAPANKEASAKVLSSTQGPELLYKQGLDQIRVQQKFAAGRAQLEEFIKKYPNHDLHANAMYWIGEALYGEKEFERAILQFQDVIQKFSSHPKAASAMFKQALSFKSLGDNQNAKTTFQKLRTTYPESPEAEMAKQQIDQL